MRWQNVLLSPFFIHLSIGTPAQEKESGYDEDTASDGGWGERYSGSNPVYDGDEEDGEATDR